MDQNEDGLENFLKVADKWECQNQMVGTYTGLFVGAETEEMEARRK